MMKIFVRILFIVVVLSFPVNSFCAEAAKLRHISSVYFDAKGAGISTPEGVAYSDKSILIIADSGNGRLLKYTYKEGVVKGGDEIKVPEMSYPLKVQVNSAGEVFVLDGKQRRIIRLGSDGTSKGYLDPAGLTSPSTFVPESFKIDASGNIYILDIFSGRVIVLDPSGKFMRQLEFPENYGFFTDLAVDSRGAIFILDAVKADVYSALGDAKSFTLLTKGLKEYMNFPISMTIDNRGVIYLADQNGSGIVALGQDGSFQGRLVTFGWKEGLVRYPSQIFISEKGEFFVADRENNRVQIFSLLK